MEDRQGEYRTMSIQKRALDVYNACVFFLATEHTESTTAIIHLLCALCDLCGSSGSHSTETRYIPGAGHSLDIIGAARYTPRIDTPRDGSRLRRTLRAAACCIASTVSSKAVEMSSGRAM